MALAFRAHQKTHLQVTTSVWVQMFLPCWVLFSRTGKYGALFGYTLSYSLILCLQKACFLPEYIGTMQWQALFIFFLGPKSPCDNFPRLRLLPFITLPLTTPFSHCSLPCNLNIPWSIHYLSPYLTYLEPFCAFNPPYRNIQGTLVLFGTLLPLPCQPAQPTRLGTSS